MAIADEDFANAPQSITELRAKKVDSAALWTPRDVLIEALRRIDRGEFEPDVLVLVCRTEGKNVVASVSSPNGLLTLGVLEAAKLDLHAVLHNG